MGTQWIGCRQLSGHLRREVFRYSPCFIDPGQLRFLRHGIFGQFAPFDAQLGLLEVSLRAHRNIFARGHRHRTADQRRNAADKDMRPIARCRRDPKQQAGYRDDTIIRAQSRRSQRSSDRQSVLLFVGLPAAHWVIIKQSFRVSSTSLVRQARLERRRLRAERSNL